jgi:Ala-tRNA(Pro) deacylase
MDLRNYLEQQGIHCAWSHHDAAYTAQDLAMKEHVPGRKVVKPVVVSVDGKLVMCALPAACCIDMERLREELHADVTELADEPEFKSVFGDCELGAEPPIGGLFGLPTVMDDSLMTQDQVTFQAGTHSDAVTMSVSDYIRLTQPKIAHFGKPRA